MLCFVHFSSLVEKNQMEKVILSDFFPQKCVKLNWFLGHLLGKNYVYSNMTRVWQILLLYINYSVFKMRKSLLHVFCWARPGLQRSNISIFVHHQANFNNCSKLHVFLADIWEARCLTFICAWKLDSDLCVIFVGQTPLSQLKTFRFSIIFRKSVHILLIVYADQSLNSFL